MCFVLHFVDDDAGYQAWTAGHSPCFVINTYRAPSAAYLKLHRASCKTITGEPARGLTFTGGDYSKVCGDRDDLETFARSLGGHADPCGLCLREQPSRVQVGPSRPETAGHVFISYVREDSAAVDRLQRSLEDAGIRVWRDTADLWPGEDWAAKIHQAITDDALVFIACFSKASAARERSYQREEVLLAVSQLRLRRPDVPWLIPVRLDDCEIPALDIGGGRTLAAIHWADLFGSRSGESLARLVGAVERILGNRSGSASRADARTVLGGSDLPAGVASMVAGLNAADPGERISSLRQVSKELASNADYHWQLVTVVEQFVRETAMQPAEPLFSAAGKPGGSRVDDSVHEAIKALAYRARVWEPRGLDLSDSDLRGVRVPRAWFPRANLSNSWLDAADLMEAHLEGANLARARLNHVNLRRSHLADADLRGAILHDASLVRADMRNSRLGRADLSLARLHLANFIGAKVEDANLSKADTTGAVGLNQA
jgi:hypothetical protein